MTEIANGIFLFDDFLPRSYFNSILNNVSNLEWKYVQNIASVRETKSNATYGFVHPVCLPRYNHDGVEIVSNMYQTLEPIIHYAASSMNKQVERLIRIKINLTTYNSEQSVPGAAHIDLIPEVSTDYHTAILYLNDNDGDTVIYKNSLKYTQSDMHITTHDVGKSISAMNLKPLVTVTPAANRLVIFPGHHVHEGLYPLNSKEKVVINMNFTMKELS